jgi:hypothetical protein
LNYLSQDTREWVASRTRRSSLSKLNWSPERLRRFLSICGDQMIKQGYASRDEVDGIMGSTRPLITPLAPLCSAVVPKESLNGPTRGNTVLPLKLRAGQTSHVIFDRLDARAMASLSGSISLVAAPAGLSMRTTVILTDSEKGEVLASHAATGTLAEPALLRLAIPRLVETIDVLMQVRIAEQSAPFEHCEIEIRDLRLESS